MRNWIVRWVASAVALLIVAHIVPGIHLDRHELGPLVIAVVALALVNSFVRPIIMFFVWPINCMTFGLLGFVINVILFWIVGSGVIPGFRVTSFTSALIGSIAMGACAAVINYVFKDKGDSDRN